MPLYRYTSTEAVTARKENALGSWPPRSSANRVEPVCLPGFAVPFQFVPGEGIFTIGSCFARNIESELSKRGFRIPVAEIMSRPEFSNKEPNILNNFGTPSIYNELAWALGEREYVADDHLLEVMPGKWIDMHRLPTTRPEDRETVEQRSAAIRELYKAVTNCRVVIVTLGYVEVWFDTNTGYYLNATPRPAALKKYPERFELHVLSFDEVYSYLKSALSILRRHGHPEIQVIITVSPVALGATHRDQDVIVANCYSKSVLRAAAESACAEHNFVTYYPSYESVTLSNRKFAWLDDQVHVSRDIVAVNVGRMVDAYVGSDVDFEAVKKSVLEGGLATALAAGRKLSENSPADADAFFEYFSEHFGDVPEFATLASEHLVGRGNPEAALRALAGLPPEMLDTADMASRRATILAAAGNHAEALAVMKRVTEDGTDQTKPAYMRLLTAALGANDEAEMRRAVAVIAHRFGRGQGMAQARVGNWYLQNGRIAEAEEMADAAIRSEPDLVRAWLLKAEVLVAKGETGKVIEVLARLDGTTASEQALIDKIKRRLI